MVKPEEKAAVIVAAAITVCVVFGLTFFAIPNLINSHTDAGLFAAAAIGLFVISMLATAVFTLVDWLNEDNDNDEA